MKGNPFPALKHKDLITTALVEKAEKNLTAILPPAVKGGIDTNSKEKSV
jgi:hypothetical protein